MGKITINLTTAEEDAFEDMLGSTDNIESYLKGLASNHEEHQLDDRFSKKTKAQKKALLDG